MKAYLVKFDALLQLMARVKIFIKGNPEERSPAVVQIEKLVSQHLQCIFSSVEHDLGRMAIEDTEEEKKERVIKMRPITTKLERHAVLDLFKKSSLVSPRLEDFGKFCLNNKRIINKFIQLGQAPRNPPRHPN